MFNAAASPERLSCLRKLEVKMKIEVHNILASVLVFMVPAITVATVNTAEKIPTSSPFTIPVSGMRGDPVDLNRVSGLALTVEDAGWPGFSMLAHPFGTFGTLSAPYWNLTPFQFGTIRMSEAGHLVNQKVNEVSNTLTFANDKNATLQVTMTRLSPAVLLESSSTELELFGVKDKPTSPGNPATLPLSNIKPLRWATPRADGTVATGVLGSVPILNLVVTPEPSLAPEKAAVPPVANLGQTWLLLWYGSGSPFASSKVPGVMMGNDFTDPVRRKTVFQADVPFLFVFEKSPQAIELNNVGQLAITFPGAAGKVVMLPLFGHDVQAAGMTEKWLKEFPEEIKNRCDDWVKRLGDFPVNVKEITAYNSRVDRVTISEKFEYTSIRKGGEKTALIRPMLALGLQQKLPVVVTPQPVDLKYATQFGPLMAVSGDHYEWHLDGLGKYVAGREIIGPANNKSAELEKELSAEVDKVLAVGHLAPWVEVWGMPWVPEFGTTYFREPSEVLYFLSDILPVLPAAQQARVCDYLANEAAAYPPDQWQQLKIFEGARQNYYQVPKDLIAGYNRQLGTKLPLVGDEYYEGNAPSLFRAYGVSRFYQSTNRKPAKEAVKFWRHIMSESLTGRQWDTLGWFWGKYASKHGAFEGSPRSMAEYISRYRLQYLQFTPRALHRDAAGLIGYCRLCRMAGEKGEPEAWGQLARLLAFRFALTRYGRYLDESGLFHMPDNTAARELLACSGDFSVSENHFEQVWEVNQHEVVMLSGTSKEWTPGWFLHSEVLPYGIFYQPIFFDMTPEVGQILADWGLKDDAARYLKHYAEVQPIWYQSHADFTQIDCGELPGTAPSDAYQHFMAHAWIAGTPPETLERYIDVPWVGRGDFFYMHKLAETIKAYRGVKWDGK